MLSHVREGPATLQSTDLNALIDESLNLAYHGVRAESQDFNITLEREFDSQMEEVRLYPQEMARVFFNLIGNAFYATRTRQARSNETDYRPTLWVSTKDLGQATEIRFRDNGVGMPKDVAKEIFNPFFTTKPVGEGTGLGLSMSYDIVVKEHRGKLEVRSEEGEFTEFVITLPRQNA
jgi:signal transduction histidine kinase